MPRPALLIPEPPLQVLPTLAIAIGLNEAIVIQQLYYLLREPQFGKKIAEHKWIFNTVEQWVVNYFPFWSVRTVKTIFSNLSKRGLVISCQPEGRVSRRKYYRIDMDRLQEIADGAKNVPSMGQGSSHGNVQNSSLPLSKTTTKTSVQRKVKGAKGFAPRFVYPSDEEEMYSTLESHGIDPNPDYDGNFFTNMTRCGWTIRGQPIWDWIETYRSRLEVTSPSGS